MKAADADECLPNLDEAHLYALEQNSVNTSCQLSEISHVSSDSHDLEFRYLGGWGPPFHGLANLYTDDILDASNNNGDPDLSDLPSSLAVEYDDLHSSYS